MNKRRAVFGVNREKNDASKPAIPRNIKKFFPVFYFIKILYY